MNIKNAILAISTISFVSVSCSSDNAEDIIPQKEELIPVSFTVSCNDIGATRADFDNNLGVGNSDILWKKDDKILVSADNKDNWHSIFVTDSKGTQAKAEGEVSKSDGGYLCVHTNHMNISSFEKPSNNEVVIYIKESQYIADDCKIDPEVNYLVGYTKSTKGVNMETPCSFLVFHTNKTDYVKIVRVTAFGKGKDVEGNSVPYSIAGNIQVKKTQTSGFDELAGNAVAGGAVVNSIECRNDNTNLPFPQDKYFAIAVRPGEPTSLEVSLTFSDADGSNEKQGPTYVVEEMEDEYGESQPLKFYRTQYHMFPDF